MVLICVVLTNSMALGPMNDAKTVEGRHTVCDTNVDQRISFSATYDLS